MKREEAVAEQMKKLDYSHTTIERALGEAYDAGLNSVASAGTGPGNFSAGTDASPDDAPEAPKKVKKSK